jgi:hypothetical protein
MLVTHTPREQDKPEPAKYQEENVLMDLQSKNTMLLVSKLTKPSLM